MLSFPSQEKLKAALLALGDGERDLEAVRQSLCAIGDFALHSAFERLDRGASGWVGSDELLAFLRENGVDGVTEAEADELLSFFDTRQDRNGKLTFQEFIQIVLPCEDNVLRNITVDRPSIRLGRAERLPEDIEERMAALFTKEVELARRLAPLKRELLLCVDYTIEAAFRAVDKSDSGAITTVNLGAFFREHGHSATETELLAIVRRLDTDGDAAIRYKEW